MSKTNANTNSATIKLADVQRLMLSAAAQREDRCLIRPASLRGAQIVKMQETLLAAGYVREVKAKGSAPVWRRDNDSKSSFALKLTAAGAKAVAEAGTSFAGEQGDGQGNAPRATDDARLPGEAVAKRETAERRSERTRLQGEPRPTSKIASVIELLSQAAGATLAALIAATDWLPHTTRAALTGLRKRGYVLTLDRGDRQRGSVYRIASKPDRDAGKSLERAVEAA
jgi:hypothetical protein